MNVPDRAVQEVRATHAAWIAAVNAGELAQLMSLMSDDVVLINPDQPPIGREAFPALFAGAHRQFELHCSSDPLSITVAGDVAYTCARDELRLTPRAGGASVQLAGHRLTVYRRDADGRWRLARDAHTLAPVPD